MNNPAQKYLVDGLMVVILLVTSLGVAAKPNINTSFTNTSGGNEYLPAQSFKDGESISIDFSVAFEPRNTALPIVGYQEATGNRRRLPINLTMNRTTGVLSGTFSRSASTDVDRHNNAKNNYDEGEYEVRVRASDGSGNSAWVYMIIYVTNVAPVATADTASGLDNGPNITGNVLANDADGSPDTDALTVSDVASGTVGGANSGTYGAVTINTNGSFIYVIDNTAVQNAGTSSALTDTFTYTVHDKYTSDDSVFLTDSTTLTITINRNNSIPVLTVTALSATEDGGAVSATPGLTDPDAGDTHSYIVGALNPAGQGSVTIVADTGRYTFDPGTDFQSLAQDETTSLSFNVTVTDNNGATDTETVTVTVTGVNDLPVVTGIFAGAVIEGNLGDLVTATAPIDITDVDSDNTPTFSTDTDGVYGTISFAGDNWVYTLDQSTVQELDVDDEITDTIRLESTSADPVIKVITITITGANDAPVIDDQEVTIPENSPGNTFVLNLGALDVDVDDTDFTFAILGGLGAIEEFIVNDDGDILVSGSEPDVEPLNFEIQNLYVFTLHVTDSQGATDTAEITVNLTDEFDAPGVTVCEQFDADGNSRDTLDPELTPLLNYYSFTAADPCHRVIFRTDNYFMDQERTLVAENPLASIDTGQTNYGEALSQITAATFDEDTATSDLIFTLRRLSGPAETSGSTLSANVRFMRENGATATDGSFVYIPLANVNFTDNGRDSFVYRVCDPDGDESEARCAYGVVYVRITKKVVPPVLTDNVVVGSERLASTPLELATAAMPNIFLLIDDSGSMGSDIISEHPSGYYQYLDAYQNFHNNLRFVNTTVYTVLPFPGFGSSHAPSEATRPDHGLWRLRSSAYNKIYYNPNLTYSPWSGLNFAGNEYTNAPVTAALSEPYYPERGSVNLTTDTNVTFRQYVDYDYDNRNWNWPITDDITWLARYYIWTDKNTGCPGNVAGVVDGTSPHLFPGGACTEGTLIEIKDPSTEYYKGTNRSDCEAEGFCTYTEELQNFANFYSYSRNRSLTAKTSISAAVTSSDNMRIGFGAFNQDTDNIQIAEMNESATEAGHKLDVLQRIHRLKTNGGTPIPSALEATGQYYSCAAINIIRPENFTECPISPAPEGNCQQNFTLVMTDGIWNGSTNKRSFTVDNDSDGLDANGGASPWDGGDRYSDNTSSTLADIAMYYYENDLDGIANNNEVPANERDLAGAAPSAFPGYPSNPTMHQHMSTFVITFGLEGTISENQVPDFGEVDNTFSWGSVNNDEGKLNDMLHTAINGRGAFLSAGDTAELSDALTNTFEAFSQANGTASAVSFNSQELVGDSVVFRAFYNIRENSGDLVAVPLIIDVENGKVSLDNQDWSAAQQLFRNKTHLTRNILTFDNQVASGRGGIAFRANTLNDSQKLALSDNIDPVADPSAFAAQITKHVKYLRGDSSQEWPVGNLRKRARAANTDRDEDGNLITSNDEGPLGDIINSTPVFYGAPDRTRRNSPPYPTSPGETYEEFKTAEKDRPAVVYVGSNDGLLHGFSALTGDEVFAYMPGLIIDGFYSEKVKNLLSTNYAHRYTVDLSAAINDAYLDADRDNVTHTAEARMDWTTVLIGGFRGGAKGYFALDITDPTAMIEGNVEVSGQVTRGPEKVVMWEFTDADDIHPLDGDSNVATDQNGQPASDLGYTYSQPTIAMSNVEYQGDISDNVNKRWISIFGNGYNSSGGNASLFGTFIDGGTDGTWCHPAKPEAERCDAAGKDPGSHDFVKLEPVVTGLPAGFANGMGEPRGIDIDSNGTLDIAYAGDRLGNLYRFDLRNPDPALWSVSNIFTARYFAPDGSGAVPQPITTQPLVIVHPTVRTGVDCGTDFDTDGNLISRTCGGFIVVFATGSYLYDGDDTSREVQGMYGIWDKLGSAIDSTFDANGEYNELVKQEYTAINTVIDTETNTETTDPVTGVITTSTTTISNNVSTRTLSENTVDYGNKRGWYLSFDHAAVGGLTPNTPQYPGEKAVRNLQSRGGIAFVNSIIPKENLSCGVRSGGAANAFCADTGTLRCVTAAGVFDINDDGLVDDFDLAAGSRAIIASTFFEDSVPTDSTFISGTRVTQLGKDVLDVRLTKTSDGKNTGRISWQRLKED